MTGNSNCPFLVTKAALCLLTRPGKVTNAVLCPCAAQKAQGSFCDSSTAIFEILVDVLWPDYRSEGSVAICQFPDVKLLKCLALR